MRTLLIDADIIAYQAAATNQTTHDWGDGNVSVTTDMAAAKDMVRQQIDRWVDELGASAFVLCLSDDLKNFRKGVDPTYKASRSKTERPELLYKLKDWMASSFPFDRRRTLEADDVLGILATEPHQGTRIIVSADKDLQTIPGLLYRPLGENPQVREITEAEADFYHLFQTLTGDATDNYPGCPGVGPVKAEAALRSLTGVLPVHREITRGARKGEIVTEYEPAEMDTPWDVVVSLFIKAGLTAQDALVQARLARILRASDYDGKRPILWTP